MPGRAVAMVACLLGAGGCDVVFGGAFEPSCPKTMPDERDADADCVADDSDNCPSTPNFDQADEGERAVGLAADGVGDACDPNPALAGDVLVFESFADPQGAAARWLDPEAMPEQWQFEVGSVAQLATDDSFSYLQRAMVRPAGSSAVFELGFTLLAFGDRVNGYPDVRLFLDDNPAELSHGLYCAIVADRTGDARDRLLLGDPIGGATSGNVPRLEGMHAIRVRMHRTEDLLQCELDIDGMYFQISPHARGDTVWPAIGTLGVRTNRAAVRIDWITLYVAP